MNLNLLIKVLICDYLGQPLYDVMLSSDVATSDSNRIH